MEECNILKYLWKNRHKYGLIDEDLSMENTFIQQTSGNEYLWKAQLGVTKHYVILLRCEVIDISASTIGNNLLINMIPMSQLNIKRHSSRKLQILFPSGSIGYFKLLMSQGCGKAWTRWRTLESLCGGILPQTSVLKLISLSDLDGKIVKILKDQKFLKYFGYLKSYSVKNSDSSKATSGNSCRSDTTSTSESDSGISSSSSCRNSTKSDKISNSRNDANIINFAENVEQQSEIPNGKSKRKNNRKTRMVKRFGEGIEEGCVFDLSLSYSDELTTEKNDTIASSTLKVRKNSYDNLMNRNIFLESMPSTSIGSIGGKTQSIKNNESNRFENFYQRDADICFRNALKATKFFTNVTLTVVPNAFRRSKSIDSVYEFTKNNSQSYLMHNISLPNLNEIMFHQRNNRLSYSTDYFYGAKSVSCSIRFWLPDANKVDGRIYYSNPMRNKKQAYHYRTLLMKQRHLLLSNLINTVIPGCILRHKHRRKQEQAKPKSDPKSFIKTTENEYRKLAPGCRNESRSVNSTDLRSTQYYISPKTILKPFELVPEVAAYELIRIQQRLFCEMETSEIARFMLRPHTVTEVNCPYLCGFLCFFERLKNFVTSEILSQQSMPDFVETYSVFVKVALASFKRRDEQSGYAIITALCNPLILKHEWWIYFLKSENVSYLCLLFRKCWNNRNLSAKQQSPPFYLNFLTFIVKELMKKMPSLNLHPENSFWNKFGTFSNNSRNKCSNLKRSIHTELKIMAYENLGEIFTMIEECRKYFLFYNFSMTDNSTREYLLFKEYKTVV